MKINKYIFLSLCASLVSFSSCVDLDQEPDERVTLTTVDQVKELLSTAYSTGNYGWLCEISSDNIIDINAPYMATQSDGKEIKVRYNLTSYGRADDEAFRFEPVKSSTDSDSPTSVWEGCYNAIATANHAIALLDQMKAKNNGVETSQMTAAYAEARLCRAYNHFILVNVFCQAYKTDEASKSDIGIAYVTDPEDKVVVNHDRSNVTDTYNKIEEDLVYGLAHVSNSAYSKPKWHFNENAAHAFAARFYLYKREYDKVIEQANAVLGTDRSILPSLLIDRSAFDGRTTSTDYTEVWQDPSSNNNLMLVATNSRQWRRSVGYRYATAGKAVRDIFYHLGPNWRWYCMPAAGVSGELFYDGTDDHGFKSNRIGERFEYSDKVAGIGYAHVIRREFTNCELLLERAEAYLLGRHDITNAVADMIAYEESRQSFSAKTKAHYAESKALTPLTKDMIKEWYVDYTHSNTLKADVWANTQKMSSDFVVPDSMLVYMNCLNDMRRYETAWTGLRFFDLKRWGLPITHSYDATGTTVTLQYNDARRAIEIPQEVIAAGVKPSQTSLVSTETTSSQSTSVFKRQ